MTNAVGQTLNRWREALRTAGERWGSTPDEEAASYPCDDLLPELEQWLFRAIDVDAPPATTFRWICQLRVAPYSYDWIDNWGRRSPRALTPGLEDVRPGQTAMTMFEIVDVEPGSSITVRSTRSTFGDVAATYRVVPVGDDRSRIVAKLGAVPPGGLRGALLRDVLPLGDLIMMRKQLKTLAVLATRTATATGTQPASGSVTRLVRSAPRGASRWLRIQRDMRTGGTAMAVGVVLDFEGATLDQYDEIIDKMGFTPGGPGGPGGMFHWVTKTGSGMRVTDVWATKEQFEKFAEEKIGPISAEVGLPAPPSITFYEVHNYLTAG